MAGGGSGSSSQGSYSSPGAYGGYNSQPNTTGSYSNAPTAASMQPQQFQMPQSSPQQQQQQFQMPPMQPYQMYGGVTPWLNPNVSSFSNASQQPSISQASTPIDAVSQSGLPQTMAAQNQPTTRQPVASAAALPSPIAPAQPMQQSPIGQAQNFDLSQINQTAGLPAAGATPVTAPVTPPIQPAAPVAAASNNPLSIRQWRAGLGPQDPRDARDYQQYLNNFRTQ